MWEYLSTIPFSCLLTILNFVIEQTYHFRSGPGIISNWKTSTIHFRSIKFKRKGITWQDWYIGYTKCVTDLDELNLVKFGYGGLVLGTIQFSQLPQLPQKWCSIQKWSKVTRKKSSCFVDQICDTLCRNPSIGRSTYQGCLYVGLNDPFMLDWLRAISFTISLWRSE